ncbi:hypothetical protein OAM14_00520 [Candidatus Pelagibacter sp.]|nr:hypothetical protein [Candidatus Pelagibacter sp.]
MMIFQKYNTCFFCGSVKIKITKNEGFSHNFYTKAIKNDLKLTDESFRKMKVYECEKCHIVQNNPWFSKEISFRIFNQIYGQHNKNWLNAINFFEKGIKPDHGRLFEIINKYIKVKNYCELNAPFMGFMIDYFSEEFTQNKKSYKDIFDYTIKYLSARQVAGEKKTTQNKKQLDAKKYLNKLDKIKNKNCRKKKVNKFLIIDHSYLNWVYNDNYKSVNSRSLASELLNIQIQDFNLKNKTKKYDLFGIFNTLDHTHQPKKILDYALNNSKYVIIYCHSNESLEKQHLFSLTDKFLSYLKKKKIFCKDLTLEIDVKFKSKKMYLLCSKFFEIKI